MALGGMALLNSHLANALVNDGFLGQAAQFAERQPHQALLALLGRHLRSGETNLLLGYCSLRLDLARQL